MPTGIAGRAEWLEEGITDRGASAGGHPLPAGGPQVHLLFGDDTRPEAGHLALVCAEYDATVERLRAAGHEVEPRREHWGSPRAYVRDPAGNLVELMAWPPGGSAPTDPASPSS